MSNNSSKIIIINGKRWKDVTNETTAGITYSLSDVIRCGGEAPKYASND